jgi:transposase
VLPDSEFVLEIRTASLSPDQSKKANRSPVLLVLGGGRRYADGFRVCPVGPAFLPPVSPRRLLCHVLSRFPSASRFFRRWRAQAEPAAVAAEFGVPVRTIRRLFARFARRGDDGLAPDYSRCGQHQAGQTPAALVEAICQTRRDHPRWGSEMIRLELQDQAAAVPVARTIRRHLHQAGLQPAPAGRPPATHPRVPRADRPHQGWQVDASEELRLQDQQRVCWLRVVDECSGAFLQTVVFPCARWEHVTRQQIQDSLRRVFRRWGLPERLRVDNGYPWGSVGEFPTEMALWLIGLGITMVWIPPACPQNNGVVERAQGVGQSWVEPQTCHGPAELQQRCDDLDRRQRERYPYRDGRSRWQVYPTLRHSGRKYSRRRERSHWEAARAWAAVAQQVVQRQVDCNGSVTVYSRHRYVGKPFIGTQVYVSLDPTGPTWVIADAAGRQLRTHPADELAAERICSLTVSGRPGK